MLDAPHKEGSGPPCVTCGLRPNLDTAGRDQVVKVVLHISSIIAIL